MFARDNFLCVYLRELELKDLNWQNIHTLTHRLGTIQCSGGILYRTAILQKYCVFRPFFPRA